MVSACKEQLRPTTVEFPLTKTPRITPPLRGKETSGLGDTDLHPGLKKGSSISQRSALLPISGSKHVFIGTINKENRPF